MYSRSFFFTKRRWPFFSFFVERVGLTHEGFIISFPRAPGPLQVGIRNYGKTVRRVSRLRVSPLSPSIGLRVCHLIFFFHKKTILQLYIMYCYYIFLYYMRVQRKVFFGVKWGDTDSSGYREHNDLTLSGGFSYCRYCFVFAIYGFFIEDLKNSLIFLMASLRTERVTRHPA